MAEVEVQKAKKFSLSAGTIMCGILMKKARNQTGFNLMNPWAERKIALHEKCIVYGDLDATNAKDGVPITAESVVMNATLDNKPFAFKVMTPNPDARIAMDFIEMYLNAPDEESRITWVTAINGAIEEAKKIVEEEQATERAVSAVQSATKCSKKLSTGFSYNTRYCWVDTATKTFHWSKVNDMSASKSISCRNIQNVLSSMDDCGFSIMLRDTQSLPAKLFGGGLFASVPRSIDIKFDSESTENCRLRDAFISQLKALRTASTKGRERVGSTGTE